MRIRGSLEQANLYRAADKYKQPAGKKQRAQ
mgnify:CR=1 FL=1